MEIEDHLLYTKEHEWVNIDGDEAYVGISDYAQESSGILPLLNCRRSGMTWSNSASWPRWSR